MKKIIFTGFAAAALILAAVSCQREEFEGDRIPGASAGNLVPMTITASLEADTKAALQSDGKVFWESGDALTVMAVDESGNKSASYEFSTDGEGAKADFTGLVDDETAGLSAGWYAVYPPTTKEYHPYLFYNEDNGYTGYPHTIITGTINMFLPSIQKTTSNASGLVSLSTGVVNDDADMTLNMKNVGGLIAVTLPTNDITNVILYGNSGETIAGVVTASFDDSGLPVVSDVLGSNVIRIVPSVSAETFSAGTYYINLPPMTFDKGLTLLFINKDNKYAFVRSSDTFVVERAKISEMPAIPTLNFSGKVVRFAFFDDYGIYNNPLMATSKEENVNDKTLYLPSSSSVSHSGTYVYYDDTDGYPWEIKGSDYVMQNSGKCGGFVFGNQVGDYLALPKLDGYVLNRVIMRTGLNNYSTAGNPTLTTKPDSEGNYYSLVGCDIWSGNKQGGMEYIWNFSGNTDQDYAITLTRSLTGTQCCRIQGLLLFYTDAPEAGCPSVNPMITSLECHEPVVAYANNKIKFTGSFSAIDYSDFSQFTCGFDYKYEADSEWTSVTCQASSFDFSSDEITLPVRGMYTYRAWVKFVRKDGTEKTVYGEEASVDMSRIILSMVFDDSYWGKTAEGSNTNFLAREWGWNTNQNTYAVWNDNGREAKSYMFKYNGAEYPFNFWTFAGLNKYDTESSEEASEAKYGEGAVCTIHANGTSKETRGLCLSYWNEGTPHAWMKLPAVENFRLTSITGDLHNSFTIFINDAVDTVSENTNVLGTPTGNQVAYQTGKTYMDLKLQDSQPGVRYYFCSKGRRATIRNMTLTYEYAGE